jgi:serine/threonine protein kinase
MTAPLPNFADHLVGQTLNNSWRVVRQVARKANATGGVFSKPYIVQDGEGNEAFCKAIDLMAAHESGDVVSEMQRILRAYLYERDLVARCASAKMDRIVKVWDSGQINVQPGNPFSMVPFLIFEMADGDMHAHLDFSVGIDVAFTVRTLHEVSVALVQLHQHSIAHQDIKPSNVVVFKNFGAKLSDLGRASTQGVAVEHDDKTWAGDGKYTPPELLYGFGGADWGMRRLGCDTYMFGALATFLLTGLCMAVEIQRRLPPPLQYDKYRGAYADVLPYLRQATNEVILEVEPHIPSVIRSDIVRIVRELCDADPAQRGHPQQRKMKHGNPFDLRRYTTELDVLRRKAETLVLTGRTGR